MITVFKAGGDWKTKDGKSYTAKPVNKLSDAGEGYFATLVEALKVKPKKAAAKKAIEPTAETADLLGE
tara:strand:+ start:5748 stop:5951 length:204 start_codon:yes stop_codon:yes gene_type:complete